MAEQSTGDWGPKLSVSSRRADFPIVGTAVCAVILIVGGLVAIALHDRQLLPTGTPAEVTQKLIDHTKSLVDPAPTGGPANIMPAATPDRPDPKPTLTVTDQPAPASTPGPRGADQVSGDRLFLDFLAWKHGYDDGQHDLQYPRPR